MKRFLKVIDCTQQLQVRDNVVGFEKALGAVKVIKDQIQYRSQSLLNLARGYFSAVVNFIMPQKQLFTIHQHALKSTAGLLHHEIWNNFS